MELKKDVDECDRDQRFVSLFRYRDNTNCNRGFDGINQLIAGICTELQQKWILEHLFSPDEMWTEVGVSTVDRSAPYYKADGYWNGAVWMPHQFLLWKTLLDFDLTEKAYKLVFTVLDM